MITARRSSLWGSGLVCLILAATTLTFTGCSSRPENSPVIRKSMKDLADLQTQVGEMSVQVKQMNADLSAIRKEVADSKLAPGSDSLARIDELNAKIAALEEQLGKAGTKPVRAVASATDSKANAAAASYDPLLDPGPAPATTTTTTAPKSEKTEAAPAKTTKAVAKESGSSKSEKVAKTSSSSGSAPVRQAANTSRPKPRGAYYSIKSGDTPESIAKSHGITLKQFLEANRIPSSATLFPGQKVFIPSSQTGG